MVETKGNGLDRSQVITWVLQLLVGMALAVGAWFFGGLADRIDSLTVAVQELRTTVARQQDALNRADDREARVRLLEERVTRLEEKR